MLISKELKEKKNNINLPVAIEAIVDAVSNATSFHGLELSICIVGLFSVMTSGLCQRLWSGY